MSKLSADISFRPGFNALTGETGAGKTALLSALLDNVTTVLLIGPMTITVCRLLDIDAVPFFLAEIMASNIGGTATLIGDPPNIMIGSAAHLTFMDFLAFNGPAIIVIMVVAIAIFYVMYGRNMGASAEQQASIMELSLIHI